MAMLRLGRETEPHLRVSAPAFAEPAAAPAPKPRESKNPARFSALAFLFAGSLSAFWIGSSAAFLLGFYGPARLAALEIPVMVLAVVASFLPPFLFIATAYALVRARAMGEIARRLAAASERMFTVDESASAGAQNLGRAVRREIDALNTVLDGAFNRLRALETAIEERVAQLEDAGARASVKAGTIADRLRTETEAIDTAMSAMGQTASTAAETVAGRAAQLKALIEAAAGELKAAGQTLDSQSAQFREASEKAATAPQAAALELDRQARHIETAAETVVARAEFVLARQERQRAALGDMLTRLREESASFEQVLEAQRTAVERAASSLSAEAQRLDELSDQGLRRIDAAMANAGARATQFTAGFGREAERVKDMSEAAAGAMTRLIDSLREAGNSAQALIVDSTAEAKRRSMDLVGEAMGQCDHLLRAASNVAEQAEKARAALAKAAEEAERHIVALPGIAAQEAARVRDTLRGETEQLLDVSARTLSALRRNAAVKNMREESNEPAPAPSSPEGMRGFARRITGTRRKDEERPALRGNFELSAVLAAAESAPTPKLKPSAAAALGALEMVLADMAIDLNGLLSGDDDAPLWRRYLDGDRGAFARHLAQSIGPDIVDRVGALYRDNPPFHEAANAYLADFESLLSRARESDRDGFLASTLLSADTGKIYLAIAYALGRLE